jgi:hypothetical protein
MHVFRVYHNENNSFYNLLPTTQLLSQHVISTVLYRPTEKPTQRPTSEKATFLSTSPTVLESDREPTNQVPVPTGSRPFDSLLHYPDTLPRTRDSTYWE